MSTPYTGNHHVECAGSWGEACAAGACPCACHRDTDGYGWRSFPTPRFVEKERKTVMMLELSTYGTLDQVDQSVEKIKSELALQGLRVEISDVYTT